MTLAGQKPDKKLHEAPLPVPLRLTKRTGTKAKLVGRVGLHIIEAIEIILTPDKLTS